MNHNLTNRLAKSVRWIVQRRRSETAAGRNASLVVSQLHFESEIEEVFSVQKLNASFTSWQVLFENNIRASLQRRLSEKPWGGSGSRRNNGTKSCFTIRRDCLVFQNICKTYFREGGESRGACVSSPDADFEGQIHKIGTIFQNKFSLSSFVISFTNRFSRVCQLRATSQSFNFIKISLSYP